jgi:hypothetical protein
VILGIFFNFYDILFYLKIQIKIVICDFRYFFNFYDLLFYLKIQIKIVICGFMKELISL